MDEQELLRRCLRCEKGAWDEFVERYSRLIYNYIYSVFKVKGISHSPDAVNDLFQDIFLNLTKDNFRKLRQFKGKNNASLASWLRIITINFCLDELKKKKPVLSLDEELGGEGGSLKDILADRRISADEQLAEQEKLQLLYDCIDVLNAQEKYFLEMHIYHGVSLEALKTSLGVSRSAVDMRKLRLIKKLRDCFGSKGFRLDT
ncbi:MAG: sigma-70 family RNA polymerase sigma factor [Candidatus Omnitrophota bacterium]